MAGKRTPEEQREYMRQYREKAKEEGPKSEKTPYIKEGYPVGWDGVIGNMSQEARDKVLTRMLKKEK